MSLEYQSFSSLGLPLEGDRGLCRGWCRLWCPRDAGQGDESLMHPSVRCRPLPKETTRGQKRRRWTTLGWTQPLQSPCTCHTHRNNFPVITEGKIKILLNSSKITHQNKRSCSYYILWSNFLVPWWILVLWAEDHRGWFENLVTFPFLHEVCQGAALMGQWTDGGEQQK